MGKKITQELLQKVYSSGKRITYNYPYELNKSIQYIYDKQSKDNCADTNVKWNKLEVGKYYMIVHSIYGNTEVRLCRIDKHNKKAKCYNGDCIILTGTSFSEEGDVINIYTKDTDIILEVTRDFFEDVKNDVAFFRDIVGVLDQNNVPVNIDRNAYKQYVMYKIDNSILPYHKEISDMTVSDFVREVKKHNYGVLQHMDYFKKYCNDNLRGKYIIYFGDRGKITVMKVTDFKVEETGNDNGIMMFNLAFDNEKMMIYGNIGCTMFKYNNSLVNFFDNGSIYYMLSEDKGNALFDCYRRIRTKIESFSNKEIK